MVGFLKVDGPKRDGLLKPRVTFVAFTWHLRGMSGLQESQHGNVLHSTPNYNQRNSYKERIS